jgi:hypothetical protein
MGVQKHYKKRFTKKIVSQSFYKKIDKKSKTEFFSIFLSRFGAFLGEGSSKTRYKNLTQTQKSDQPWYFFGLRGTNQPPKVRQNKIEF